VEMDVQWSNSHFPILMHDETVDATTNGTGRPHDKSLTYLTGLLAQDYAPWKTDTRFSTTKVPYAWDFINASSVNNLNMLLHITGESPPDNDDIAKLAEYVNRFSYASRSVFMGSEAVVRAMRAQQPSWRYVLLEYPSNGNMRTNEWLQALGVIAYALPASQVTPEKVQYYRSQLTPFWTWTSDSGYDNPTTRAKMRNAGVDMLVTNQPRQAIQECTAAGLVPGRFR